MYRYYLHSNTIIINYYTQKQFDFSGNSKVNVSVISPCVPTPTFTLSSIEYFDMNNSHFYLLSILFQWYLLFTTQSDLVQTVSSTENAENYLKRVPLTLKINPYFLDFQSLRF